MAAVDARIGELTVLRVLAALVLILPLAALAQEPERLALVVGASEYEEDREAREAAGFIVPSRLYNAVRDAELVGEALTAAGFTVERLDDPSKRELVACVQQLQSTRNHARSSGRTASRSWMKAERASSVGG